MSPSQPIKRSRLGCYTCRSRKVKCDAVEQSSGGLASGLTDPSAPREPCATCVRLDFECIWEPEHASEPPPKRRNRKRKHAQDEVIAATQRHRPADESWAAFDPRDDDSILTERLAVAMAQRSAAADEPRLRRQLPLDSQQLPYLTAVQADEASGHELFDEAQIKNAIGRGWAGILDNERDEPDYEVRNMPWNAVRDMLVPMEVVKGHDPGLGGVPTKRTLHEDWTRTDFASDAWPRATALLGQIEPTPDDRVLILHYLDLMYAYARNEGERPKTSSLCVVVFAEAFEPSFLYHAMLAYSAALLSLSAPRFTANADHHTEQASVSLRITNESPLLDYRYGNITNEKSRDESGSLQAIAAVSSERRNDRQIGEEVSSPASTHDGAKRSQKNTITSTQDQPQQYTALGLAEEDEVHGLAFRKLQKRLAAIFLLVRCSHILAAPPEVIYSLLSMSLPIWRHAKISLEDPTDEFGRDILEHFMSIDSRAALFHTGGDSGFSSSTTCVAESIWGPDASQGVRVAERDRRLLRECHTETNPEYSSRDGHHTEQGREDSFDRAFREIYRLRRVLDDRRNGVPLLSTMLDEYRVSAIRCSSYLHHDIVAHTSDIHRVRDCITSHTVDHRSVDSEAGDGHDEHHQDVDVYVYVERAVQCILELSLAVSRDLPSVAPPAWLWTSSLFLAGLLAQRPIDQDWVLQSFRAAEHTGGHVRKARLLLEACLSEKHHRRPTVVTKRDVAAVMRDTTGFFVL